MDKNTVKNDRVKKIVKYKGKWFILYIDEKYKNKLKIEKQIKNKLFILKKFNLNIDGMI